MLLEAALFMGNPIKGGDKTPPSITKSPAFPPYFPYFTNKKCPQSPSPVTYSFHQSPSENAQITKKKIANPSLENEKFAPPPFLPLQLHTPLYQMYINTRHLKAYKYHLTAC